MDNDRNRADNINAPPITPAYTPDYASLLPEPPAWNSLPLSKPYMWEGKINNETDMKRLVLAKKVPTAIAFVADLR